MPYSAWISWSISATPDRCCRRSCGGLAAVVRGEVLGGTDPRARVADPEDPPNQLVRDQEEQDRRLQHVDQVAWDARLDLHQPRALTHEPEQQRGEKHTDRARATQQRDRDRVEPNVGGV